jgi:hypothetical protein
MWAASFKSLYPKRPLKTLQLRTIAWPALQIQHSDFRVLIRVGEPTAIYGSLKELSNRRERRPPQAA